MCKSGNDNLKNRILKFSSLSALLWSFDGTTSSTGSYFNTLVVDADLTFDSRIRAVVKSSFLQLRQPK